MKRLFMTFDNFMDRLGENDHVVKCAWIFVCVMINAAIAGLAGAIPALIWGGLVLLVMLINYRNLWSFSQPYRETTEVPGTKIVGLRIMRAGTQAVPTCDQLKKQCKPVA